MIALDTNVLVRLITGDDPAQAREIETFLESTEVPFLIPDLVMAELAWVLQRRNGFMRTEVGEVRLALLNRRDVVVEDEERVRTAVRSFIEGLDLADAVIIEIARAAGCDRLASGDDKPKAKAGGFVVTPES